MQPERVEFVAREYGDTWACGVTFLLDGRRYRHAIMNDRAESREESEARLRPLLVACMEEKVAHAMTEDPRPAPATDLDRVLDALDRRTVPPRDRKRLRDAVDRADAPMKGRAGADEGLRGATGHGR